MNAPTAAAATPVLELRSLNVWFSAEGTGDAHTVRDLKLSVAPGERVGLVGESGCGKTTTILAALGLLPANASVGGEVLLDGVNIISGGDASIAPHRWTDIAMVFQGAMSAFNPVKTIGWQIREALAVHRIASGPAAAARVRELLDLVGLPEGTEDRFPHELSGGMKQRAVIAMALSCEPKVLLADEPTTALDVVVQDQILRLLVDLSERLGLGLILVTHDLGAVARSCTRAAVMLGGEIIEQGTVEQLYSAPREDYTRQLFAATPNIADLVPRPARTEPDEAAPLLRVRELTVRHAGGRRRRGEPAPAPAVSGVSFEVRPGELVALVGQSGCGKTTTLQAIMGMLPEVRGSIAVDGEETVGVSGRARRALRRNAQMIYQDPYESLDVRFRIRDTLEEPLLIHRVGATKAERLERCRRALEEVGLTPTERYLDRFPHELSGGQRQRVAIATGLVLRPALLLADEPVSMLDVSVRAGVLALLSELKTEHRMGILMITHDLSTAAEYADRIIVMREGRIVEQGPALDLVRNPREEYTRLLLDSVPSPDPAVSRVA
ncbi:ABC transporter ATP-binding protein [Leucobacter sp. M11]|uniref:ABC transporter ATP-binding protein n=1 Tax=Leucobacter sp. M11 TaxID=2993565 RepID=UPI002D7E8DB6|nr:ABC transporter ATP-binding protein [Leucobacter sp. M11]MEB4615494.1 ABC transporter ATP-binding protein [Leucobacter sp. M11]